MVSRINFNNDDVESYYLSLKLRMRCSDDENRPNHVTVTFLYLATIIGTRYVTVFGQIWPYRTAPRYFFPTQIWFLKDLDWQNEKKHRYMTIFIISPIGSHLFDEHLKGFSNTLITFRATHDKKTLKLLSKFACNRLLNLIRTIFVP